MEDLVSVLMSVYKEPVEWIEKSVESIINQSYKNIEFVIILDDPTNYKASEYLENIKIRDSRVILIRNNQNIGLVRSLNKGLRYCTGMYIARMDADDYSYPNRIERQIEYLIKNQYDIVGTNVNIFFDFEIKSTKRIISSDWACKNVLKWMSCCPHPTWIVKAEIYRKLEGYREIDSCEDYDFLIRACNAGYSIANTEEVLLLYRDNPDSISHKKKYTQIVLADYLAEQFRNGKTVSTEDIENYKNCSAYQKNISSYKTMDNMLKNKKGLNNFPFDLYIKNQLRNKMIFIIKCVDVLYEKCGKMLYRIHR